MRERRTIEHIAEQWARLDRRDPRFIHDVLTPEAGGILLFRTSEQGCLNHITRYVLHAVADYDYGSLRITAEAQCGIVAYGGTLSRRMVVVDPAEATFACHRCVEICEREGLSSFNLLPDTGCSATGGARYRPGKPYVKSKAREALANLGEGSRFKTPYLVASYRAALDAIDNFA